MSTTLRTERELVAVGKAHGRRDRRGGPAGMEAPAGRTAVTGAGAGTHTPEGRMSAIKWADLTPRERDALVAERVMGQVEAHAPCGDGLTRTDMFCAPTMAEADDLIRKAYPKAIRRGVRFWPAQYCGPEYTTAIGAAWEVVERLQEDHLVALNDATLDGEDAWVVRLDDEDLTAVAPTAPEAICLAALRAVGVEVET